MSSPLRFLLLVWWAVGLLAAGCARPLPPPTAAATPTPMPPEAETVALPVTVVPARASPPAKAAAGRGTVAGQVFNLAGSLPVANTPVYLARVYRFDGGQRGIFALDVAAAPRSITQADGRFAIADVEPGEYVLAVGNASSIKTPSVLAGPDGAARVIQVAADTVTDLGAVRVDYLDR
jgi:hypothetical protein